MCNASGFELRILMFQQNWFSFQMDDILDLYEFFVLEIKLLLICNVASFSCLSVMQKMEI